MPITPVQPAAISRYFAPGTTEVLFCPAIADIQAPTNLELSAGTELTRDIADISGWTSTTNFIETPDLGTRYVGKISGRITTDDSSITFYADSASGAGDVAALLPRDTEGYIVWADGGLEGAIGDVFHVQVGSNTLMRSTDDAAKRQVSFAILEEPAEGVTLPQT